MRSTARLTAVMTFISLLAMLLMLLGCMASMLWLNQQRLETQLYALATTLDQQLISRPPGETMEWLHSVMPIMNIEKLEIYNGSRRVSALSRQEQPLVDDSPNHYYQLSAPLKTHPSLTLNMTILNPVKTWLASFSVVSTFICMGVVLLVVSILLILLHLWLYRQSAGMELLEKRSLRILQGARQLGSAYPCRERPLSVSQALDILLQEVEQAGLQRVRIDRLIREFASLDNESGVNNRLFFDSRFATLLDAREEGGEHGAIMMLRFSESRPLPLARHTADDPSRLFEFVHSLSTLVSCYPGALLARYFQNDFVVLLPHRSLKEVESIAAKLITAADALAPLKHYDKEDFIHIAITDWRSGQDSESVMARLAMAMRRSTLLGSNNWALEESPQLSAGRGSVRWRTLLEKTSRQGGPLLFYKTVKNLQGVTDHYALQGRIRDGKTSILAAEYMPLVCEMGMSSLWDQQLLARGFQLCCQYSGSAWSFPLTTDALLQRAFVQTLYKMLLEIPRLQRNCFLFELAEADVCQHITRLLPVLHGLKAFGCQIVISRAGQTMVSSGWLLQIKPALVKLDAGLVRQIDRRPENQLLVRSLAESCCVVSARVFATGVTTHEEWQTLLTLGVCGGQGNFIAPVTAVTCL